MSTPSGNDRPIRTDQPSSGTTAGHDVTSRMAGTHDETRGQTRSGETLGEHGAHTEQREPAGGHRIDDDRHTERFDGDRHTEQRHDSDRHTEQHVTPVRTGDERQHLGKIKTSAAAVFGLVFGLAALFCALTALLSPAAVVFGLIGLLLAIVGMKMAKRPGVTGKGVAIGGLITSLLGLLLGAAVIGGAAVLVNDEQRLDQFQNRIDDLRNDLPSTTELREELPS